MLQLKNETPFVPSIAVFPNQQGIDTLYVTVKATFDLGARVDVSQQQQPVRMADEWWGEPGHSSLKYASEIHLSKPSTDVIVVGDACLPGRRPVQQLDVAVSVGDRSKILRVFGDRVWERGFFGINISTPQMFETMPLVYERAFGGVHIVDEPNNKVVYEPRNPVGKGFLGKRTKQDIEGQALPNLEDPAQLITQPAGRPAPLCFAPVAPNWEPRKLFAGTYDDAWQKTRSPYLPENFDNRFFNSAHPALQTKSYLLGGEVIELTNMSPHGPLRFALPKCQITTQVRIAGHLERPSLILDTVLIEPNEMRLTLLWRGALSCDKKALKVEQVEFSLDRMLLPLRVAG